MQQSEGVDTGLYLSSPSSNQKHPDRNLGNYLIWDVRLEVNIRKSVVNFQEQCSEDKFYFLYAYSRYIHGPQVVILKYPNNASLTTPVERAFTNADWSS